MAKKIPKHITDIVMAREWVIAEAITFKPCKCPVCGQTVKLYPRKLSSALASFLIDIYNLTGSKLPESRWVNVSKDIIVKSDHHITRDYSILRFWGLIETAVETPGMWRITPSGLAFVEGRMVVPEKAYIYNNYCVRLSESVISIKEALGSKFDIRELLSAGL